MAAVQTSFGNLVFSALIRRGMNQTALAVALGVKPNWVSQCVNDRLVTPPPPAMLAKMRDVLGLPVALSLAAFGYELDTGLPKPDDDLRQAVALALRDLPDDAVLALLGVVNETVRLRGLIPSRSLRSRGTIVKNGRQNA